MKKLLVLFIVLISFSQVFSQHLPLQIGNQWHYDMTVMPPGIHYAAIAVDTLTMNNIFYFKIERRHNLTGNLLETTYDRLVGDSCYYRFRNGQENLIINFNWPDGYTQIFPTDSNCIDILRLSKGMRNIWGFNTESYDFSMGFWCSGFIDTNWVLSPLQITRQFGCYWAGDGSLNGAIINGITYGSLYPLPVELLSFSSSVVDDDVTLNWVTATETNNSGFQVERHCHTERSRSMTDWENIGFVNGNGTTTEPQTYSYKDENLSAGKYQYRLKQIDFDGTFEYSKTIEVEINSPTKFSLEQNFPNPFNPNTNIQYAISSKQFVSLKVFNTLGQEVEKLVNEYQEAGTHSKLYIVNSTLPSGVYLYQLKAGEFVHTRKMILLK